MLVYVFRVCMFVVAYSFGVCFSWCVSAGVLSCVFVCAGASVCVSLCVYMLQNAYFCTCTCAL